MSADNDFDALTEARRQWGAHHLEHPLAMYAAISLIHAQQVVTTRIDRALKPLGLTFARYEVLMLLTFSAAGSLPITKMGERLLVHPTGVTRLVDKLEAQDLARREPHPDDRRSILVTIRPEGLRLGKKASAVLANIRFGFDADPTVLEELTDLLKRMRESTKT